MSWVLLACLSIGSSGQEVFIETSRHFVFASKEECEFELQHKQFLVKGPFYRERRQCVRTEEDPKV